MGGGSLRLQVGDHLCLVLGGIAQGIRDNFDPGLGMGYPKNPAHPTSPINPGMEFLHAKLGLVGFVGLLPIKS